MKTIDTTIESKGYVATAADIEALALTHSTHLNAARWQLPAAYLRALIATTQHELGVKHIKRNAPKATDEEVSEQLKALALVQERFYEAVKRGADKAPLDPDETRERQSVIASRCVFARTSYSVLRNWILRGRHSLEGLQPKTATKRELYEATPTAERVTTFRAAVFTRQADRILEAIKARAQSNRAEAVEALQAVIGALQQGLQELVPATATRLRDPATGTTFTGTRTTLTQAEREALAEPPRPRGRPPDKGRTVVRSSGQRAAA